MRRSAGKLARRSRVLGRNVRRRKATVADLVKVIAVGARVQLVPYMKYPDFPHPRYAGRVGRVLAKRGRAYVVEFYDGGKKKKVITSPVHLRVM